jgi:branched-chain amino acid transport system ATP-binding protein
MLLDLKEIEAGYGKKSVLFGLSMNMKEGQLMALVGPNGAGKTTTLRVISGQIHPTKGSIIFRGKDIGQMRPHEVAKNGVSLVPQGSRVFTSLTVFENLEMGGYQLKGTDEFRESLEGIYRLFPVLKERRNQWAGTLSGGEQQMLAIGRGLMSRPKLLLLDEPSTGLAPKILHDLMKTIVEVREKMNTSILIVEQNVNEVLKVANEAYVMKLGRIVCYEQCAESLLHDDKLRIAYLS